MAFPATPLDLGVELLVDGVYTDITQYVRAASGITIQRGRSDWGREVDPGQCTLTVENTDGRFAPRNPSSPYFGQIGRNTPIRIVTNEGSAHADFFGTAGNKITTPDNAALDITGDIDIRFDFQPDSWNVGTEYELLGKWNTTGNQRSWYITGGSTGVFTLHWSSTGSNDLSAVSTVNGMDAPDLRQAFRITLDVNNGSGGYTVTFYRSDTIDGTWEQYDQVVTTSGTTSIFSSTAQVEVGDLASLSNSPFSGRFYEIRILNGIGGSEVANPDFTAQDVGDTSFADTAGRTWTLAGGALLRNRQIRFYGEITEWPPRWQAGGFDVTSTLQISGYFRRLKTGADPLESALRRTLPSTDDLLGYWPLEDAQGADNAASAFPSGKPAPVSGFSFAQESGLASSAALPSLLTGATARFTPRTGTGGGWTVACVFKTGSLPATQTEILRVNVKSSGIGYCVLYASTSAIRLQVYDTDGTSLNFANFTTAGAITAFANQWNQLRIRAADNGSDVDFTVNWINEDASDSWFLTTTSTGVAPGNVASVQIVGLSADLIGLNLGHMIVVDADNTFAFNDPIDGFSGETANNRVGRVIREEGIGFIVVDGALTRSSELVGPQRVQRLFDIIQNATDADGGIFYERRTQRGVVYRDRATLENQTPWLTLPYSKVMAPLEPTDDDQHIQNDVTVSRTDGSSARVEQDEATEPLNTAEPGDNPNAVGRYAASYSLDLDNDGQCEQIAAWKLHLGTWDESRYPVVRVNLARNPELIDAATRVDIGDRIQITDPPAWLPPGTIDLMVQGYTEKMDQYSWTIEYNCTPYGPWTIGVTDTDTARANTAGCELAEALDTTETSVDVLTTVEPRWIDSATYPGDFPFDIVIGGEVMTVTACTGTTTSQTFTVTRSVNGVVKSHSTGDAVSLAVPTYVAL
ncbi:hypothetical protein [Streptomyces chartreusis]